MYVYVVRNIKPLESKQTVMLIICFFMFYSMVDKCMSQWQKFSVFWQQAGHVMIEYSVAISYELWMM